MARPIASSGDFVYRDVNVHGDREWRVIGWMTIRDCSCGGTGCIESDYAPGSFYPCVTCNPGWVRIPDPPTAVSGSVRNG